MVKSASAPAESIACTAPTSSFGACGSNSSASIAWPRRCTSRASASGLVVSDSAMRSTRATMNGQPPRNSTICTRSSPWQTR